MLDYLVHLIGRMGSWGYLIIFLGATLESAAFLGVFIPGESIVLVAGFLAAQGVLDLDALIVTVAAGAAIGDSIGYELGRRIGREGLDRHGARFGLTPKRLEKADAFFSRHGGKSVFLGRFVGFARAVVPFLAGSSRMPYTTFLPYNAAGAVLWAAAIVLLGYLLGASSRVAEHWIGIGSAIIAGIVAVVLALAWLARWAVRHESDIRQRWTCVLRDPRVARSRQRFARQIAFVQARLSPTGSFGLYLTMGALVLIAASWLFGGVAEDVFSGDPLTIVDVRVASWLHAHAFPILTTVLLAVTHLNGIAGISLLAFAFALFLLWKGDWYWLLTVVLAVPGGMLLNVLVKLAFTRARPTFSDPILTLTTYSFPSGHVAAATLFYGVLAAFLVARTGAWSRRVMITLSAFFLIVLVAFSRVYLGVHYLSDVLAAFAEGVAWLTLCITSVNAYQRSRVLPPSRSTS